MKVQKDINKHIGSQLKIRRVLMGWTQERLAEYLGITFQQVQKYEKGTNRISASRLFEISNALNIDLDYFFAGFEFDKKNDNSLNNILAEEQEPYDDFLAKKETVNLLKHYYQIFNPNVRKHVLDLIRAIPKNQGIEDFNGFK